MPSTEREPKKKVHLRNSRIFQKDFKNLKSKKSSVVVRDTSSRNNFRFFNMEEKTAKPHPIARPSTDPLFWNIYGRWRFYVIFLSLCPDMIRGFGPFWSRQKILITGGGRAPKAGEIFFWIYKGKTIEKFWSRQKFLITRGVIFTIFDNVRNFL